MTRANNIINSLADMLRSFNYTLVDDSTYESMFVSEDDSDICIVARLNDNVDSINVYKFELDFNGIYCDKKRHYFTTQEKIAIDKFVNKFNLNLVEVLSND